MKMEKDETLWTTEEIAEKFKVTTTSVARWLRKGELQGIRIGNVWRVPEKSLFEFVEKSTEKGRDE